MSNDSPHLQKLSKCGGLELVVVGNGYYVEDMEKINRSTRQMMDNIIFKDV